MIIQPTSRLAEASIAGATANLREQVHQFILGCGLEGATAQEIEHATRLSGNTVRPRLVELRKDKWITTLGEVRKTNSGRQALVWLDADVARSHLPNATPRHAEATPHIGPSSVALIPRSSVCAPAEPSN